MNNKPLIALILTLAAATFAAPSCPGSAEPFEGTGRGVTETKARENANQDIANRFSTIKVDILDELSQRETSNDIKEYAKYQRKIKVESSLYTGFVKDAEQPYRENGQFVAKRYLCPNDAAKPYLDSLKRINQNVKTQKVNGSFCKDLYKAYSPRVMMFERILERLGETGEAVIADYKRVERECDDMSASIAKGYVGFEEALDKAVAEIVSKRGKVKTKIVIGKIYDYGNNGKFSDFITAELESKLVKVKTFTIALANAISNNQENNISAPTEDPEAIEIGKSANASIVITGSFVSSARQLTIRSLEVKPPTLFAQHRDKIHPDDVALAELMPERLPVITDEALAYFNKGEDLFMKGKYDDAINELSRALAVNGNLVEGYFIRGNAYYRKGNYDLAIEDYNAVLRINPDIQETLYNRGNSYLNKGNYDRAIEDYNAALRIKPDDLKALNNRGIAYRNKGNYDRAIEDYNAVLRIKPDYQYALNNRGYAYHNKGNYDRAIEDYNAALRIKPDYQSALYNRGLAYYEKDNYDRAIEDYNAALRIKPYDPKALIGRGFAYAMKGNYDWAIEDYTAALKIKSDDLNALIGRGLAYTMKRNYDRAIEDFEAILQINPNLISAKKSLEKARQEKAKAKAIEDNNVALRIKPDDHEALYNRGISYYKKGNYDLAIENFTAALRIKPDDPNALIGRGCAYYEKNNYDRAIEDYTAALKIKPDDQSALYNRGNAYYVKGNYDRAIENYEAALRINPNHISAKEYLEKARKERDSKTLQAPSTYNVYNFKDIRDNKTYRAVKIGNQVWMAENLNYNASGSKCYDNNSANCDKYGRLYDWNTAVRVCPRGWHLPSDVEWDILIKNVNPTCSSEKNCGKFLRATSGWGGTGNGTDTFGFSALPGGRGDLDGSFNSNGGGDWWSASEKNSKNAYERHMCWCDEDITNTATGKSYLYSVRCLQD